MKLTQQLKPKELYTLEESGETLRDLQRNGTNKNSASLLMLGKVVLDSPVHGIVLVHPSSTIREERSTGQPNLSLFFFFF